MRNQKAWLFYTADVFTNEIFGGNPLAVFPEAEGLTGEQMQKIAREFNLSETVFVLPPEKVEHTRRLRIFTPQTELPFAGHPTIGTAYILGAISQLSLTTKTTTIIFEEGVGPVVVKIEAENGKPVYTELNAAQMPIYGPKPPQRAELAQLLSLNTEDIRQDEYYCEAVSCGLPFLFIPLRNLAAIEKVRLNLILWEKILKDYWAPYIYVFTQETQAQDAHIHARMFAPSLGVEEDPATGSAAAALAGYLAKRHPITDGTLKWNIEQGLEMGRPSRLRVEVDLSNKSGDRQITAIRVGGTSVLVSEGKIFLG